MLAPAVTLPQFVPTQVEFEVEVALDLDPVEPEPQSAPVHITLDEPLFLGSEPVSAAVLLTFPVADVEIGLQPSPAHPPAPTVGR